jgi:hypothetical protein
MPGRIFFRNEWARVTCTEFVIDQIVFPLPQILAARGIRRRYFGFLSRYVLVIKMAAGEREVLRHRNGYIVFQLAHAIEAAIRQARPQKELNTNARTPEAREFPTCQSQPEPRPLPSFGLGI